MQGIQSSLSLPLVNAGGEVTGGVNIYASEPRAFEGSLHTIATIVGGWAPGAASDADLTFRPGSTPRAPVVLAELADIDRATGILAAERRLGLEDAADRLRKAAAQAGITLVEVAPRDPGRARGRAAAPRTEE